MRRTPRGGLAGSDVRRGAIEAAIEQRDGGTVEIVADRPVSGGCIHDSRLVELAGGRRDFVKVDADVPTDLFVREAEGLAALAAAAAIRVPRDPLPGRVGGTGFLVMEAIPTGGARRRATSGRTSAAGSPPCIAPRRAARAGHRFGFDHDNYLGGTPQPNPWSDDWADFFRRQRLGHQLAAGRAARQFDAGAVAPRRAPR